MLTVLLLAAAATAPQASPTPTALAGIRRIYLGDFGSGEDADIVREKVRARLVKSVRFAVVETPDSADAILTGATGIDTKHVSTINSYGGEVHGSSATHHRGYAAVRLVDLKSQTAVWFFEFKRGFMHIGNETSYVADQLVEQLLADAGAYAESGGETPPAVAAPKKQ